MSKNLEPYYVEILSQLKYLSLTTRACLRPYFDVGNVSAPGSGRKSVSGDDSSLEVLGLELTIRSTISLCESFSTSESDEVACWCTFLNGGSTGC